MVLNGKQKYSFAELIQNIFKNRFIIYTALFLVAGYFIFLPYYEEGKSFICIGDATTQHYPALAYYGSYIREIIRTLFLEHRLEVPEWDIKIGYGANIASTLHYYCVGDPLTLLSAFFKPEQTETCYNFLVVLRLYLSGVTMLFYCKHRNLEVYSSVIGALVYCFSGYAVSPGIFHPFFLTPMIYFPLVLLGSELLLEKKNPFIFVVSVAFALLSNFYFFYMMVIFVVMYVLLRYFTINKGFVLKDFLTVILKFALSAVTGVLIAMPVFLPNIVSLLQSDRISVERVIPMLYPKDYYLKLPEGIVSVFGSYYVYLMISAVAVFALFVLLSKFQKENIPLIVCVFVLLFFLLVPKVGSALNGFNYVTNRWVWALTFAFGYVAAKALPMAESLKPKHIIGVFACIIVFYLICYLPDQKISNQTLIFFLSILGCVMLSVLISTNIMPKVLFRNLAVLLTVVTVSVNGFFQASPQKSNLVGIFNAEGRAYSRYYESFIEKVNQLPNEGEGRYDGTKEMFDYNTAILYDIGGTGFYFSTINPGTAQFQRDQMLNYSVDQQFKNLDGRSYLAAALSVSYFLAHEDTSYPKLYGYDIKVDEKIYTSEHILPLVYAFDSVYTDYENMTVTQKQQSLLQRAVVDSDYGLPESAPEYTDFEVPFKVVDAQNVEVQNDRIVISKPKATMTISFDSVSDCELYCIFEGLDFKPSGKVDETNVSINCGKIAQVLNCKTPMNNYTSGKQDFLINLGYNPNGRTEFKMTFPDAGEFAFSDFRIVAQPMDTFFGYVDNLADSGIDNINVDKDVITFNSDRNKPGIAVVSVPFQNGWKATVDGEKAEVIKAKSGLCGIYLEEGQHEVVLEYGNPVTAVSFVMFFGGVAALVVIEYLYKKKEKQLSINVKAE